jgi:hypothetical protein
MMDSWSLSIVINQKIFRKFKKQKGNFLRNLHRMKMLIKKMKILMRLRKAKSK